MLKTHLCDLVGIEYPIIQAGMGIFTSAELVAAVSNAGGLGSLGAGSRTTNDIIPSRSGDYLNIPRALSFPFVEKWGNRREDAKREATRLQAEVTGAIEHGRFGELLPFAGQTVGLIREILPAAGIVRRIVADAEEALKRESRLLV